MNELLLEIAESGWLFNNCYQQDDGSWRVNLRRPDGFGDWFTDWAEAPTFEEALAICMDKMASAEYEVQRETKHIVDTSKPSLLSLLGLAKTPILRRI